MGRSLLLQRNALNVKHHFPKQCELYPHRSLKLRMMYWHQEEAVRFPTQTIHGTSLISVESRPHEKSRPQTGHRDGRRSLLEPFRHAGGLLRNLLHPALAMLVTARETVRPALCHFAPTHPTNNRPTNPYGFLATVCQCEAQDRVGR